MRMSADLRNHKGFTLIELVVSVAIMGILVGGGIAAYRTFNTKQLVMTAGKEYVQLLRVAQKKAKAGEKPAGCTTLSGYRVSVVANGSQATMYALCNGGSTVIVDSQKDFSTEVVFTQNAALDFQVLLGGVVGFGSVTLTNLTASYSYQVDITSEGSITGTEL